MKSIDYCYRCGKVIGLDYDIPEDKCRCNDNIREEKDANRM